MIVYVAFKFDKVKPNTKRADEIVQEIMESCETMQIGFDANGCWVDEAVQEKRGKRNERN